MDFTVSVLLGTFILSIAALFVFVWSLSNGLFGDGLLEESDDLLIGKSCGLHLRNSPEFAD
jgi:hypothetical protein